MAREQRKYEKERKARAGLAMDDNMRAEPRANAGQRGIRRSMNSDGGRCHDNY